TAPPDLPNPGHQTNDEGATVHLDIGTTAPGAHGFSAIGLPTGLSIDPVTGVVSGVINRRGAGEYTTTVLATVGTSLTGVTFGWTVHDTTLPDLPNPGTQTSAEGATITLPLVFEDAESFSVTGLPTGLTLNTSGVISGALDRRGAGDYTVTVTAHDDDAGNSTSVTFHWLVNDTT